MASDVRRAKPKLSWVNFECRAGEQELGKPLQTC